MSQIAHSDNCAADEKAKIYARLGRINLELGDQPQSAEWYQKYKETAEANNLAAKSAVIDHK